MTRVARLVMLPCSLLLVAACQPKFPVVTPEFGSKLLDDVLQGRTVLDCGLSCSWAWITAQGELRRLHDIGDWQDLAIRTSQIGAQKDAAYFYLGRAAEGLGAYTAALKYYRISGAIVVGLDQTLQCRITNTCGGFDFPRDIVARMQIVSARIEASWSQSAATTPGAPRRLTAPHASRPPSPAYAPPRSGWIDPPPVVR